jgi:hypothetical protein
MRLISCTIELIKLYWRVWLDDGPFVPRVVFCVTGGGDP